MPHLPWGVILRQISVHLVSKQEYCQHCDIVLSARQTVSQEKQSLSTQRENEARKMKTENARMADEVRTTQARFQSLELKCERANDRVNELLAKQIEEE